MLFAEMSDQDRSSVIAWVKNHVWGREAAMSADGVLFGVVDPALADQQRLPSLNFVQLQDLVRWAGY